jgi:hypothetical protein
MLEEETTLTAETARAMRELARTVTDAPPLRLAPSRGARAPRPARPRPDGPRRWTLWAVPLTAAVAVIALAVALVTIRDLPSGRVAPPTAPASSPAAGVPAYYAAPELLCKTCGSTRLVVGDTFTGKQLAAFPPPRGTMFEAVSAAADDRTFVAQTVEYPIASSQHVMWFLLTITPGASTPARLTRLPIRATPADAYIGTIALSPSGRELAVAYQYHLAPPGRTVLQIYSVATGKLLNSWSTTDQDATLGPAGFLPYRDSNNLLSWVDDGSALSFTTSGFSGLKPAGSRVGAVEHVAVRTLNVAARGGDLIRDSRVVWSQQYPGGACDGSTAAQLTADGQTVVCPAGSTFYRDPSGKREVFPLAWLAYQLAEPKAARTLGKFTVSTTGREAEAVTSVQWANGSGSTLIVAWLLEWNASSALHVGLISHGSYTPVPTPPGISLGGSADVAW